jgi:hypothetical protein
MGNNWFQGNLTNYELHAKSNRGFGADLIFKSDAPSARGGGGSGKTYYDPSLTKYFTWFMVLPSGMVQGNLTYDGQTHEVKGRGYHDHNGAQWI